MSTVATIFNLNRLGRMGGNGDMLYGPTRNPIRLPCVGGGSLQSRFKPRTALSAVGRTVQTLKPDRESTCDGGVIWKLQSGPARDLDSALLLST
jgi:hypothetical protein